MQFSVIITTFNRMRTLPRAVESVLSQGFEEMELIIVDDGSTDGTTSFLDGLSDSFVTVIHRENGGLSAARNTGIDQASGDWIAFLDDDDMALPGWLSGFASLVDEQAGVVCCGAEWYTPAGTHLSTGVPWQLHPMFESLIGSQNAGTFAVRTDVVRAIGGFEERMTCSHQTEFWIRLVPAILDRNLHIRTTDRVLVRLEGRAPTDRPMSSPDALYQGTKVLLDKHRDIYARYPHDRANLYGVLGVSAARLGYWEEARSALWSSARSDPSNIRRWMRLIVASFPLAARSLWHAGDYQSEVPK